MCTDDRMVREVQDYAAATGPMGWERECFRRKLMDQATFIMVDQHRNKCDGSWHGKDERRPTLVDRAEINEFLNHGDSNHHDAPRLTKMTIKPS